MLIWDPNMGTMVRGLQGLARSMGGRDDGYPVQAGAQAWGDNRGMGGVGETITFDDGSTMSASQSLLNDVWTATPSIDSGNIAFTGASGQWSTTPAAASAGTPQSSDSWWNGGNITNLLTSIISAKQTYDVNQINKELVRQGKAPLTASAMQSLVPQVRVGVASDTAQMALIGIGILAAALIVPKLLK